MELEDGIRVVVKERKKNVNVKDEVRYEVVGLY